MNNYSEVCALLEILCSAKGVSGAENKAAQTASELLGKYMPVKTDPLGSVTGTMGKGDVHILLDAHLFCFGFI